MESDFKKISGRFESLENIELDAESYYFQTSQPQFYWPQARFFQTNAMHRVKRLKDVMNVGVWNLYHLGTGKFIKNMSYPNSLSHFGVNYTIKNDGRAYDEFEIEIEFSQDIDIFDRPAFLIGGHDNHYHWLLNWLPRLFLWKQAMKECKDISEINFIVHSHISKSHLDSIVSFGISPSKIVKLDLRRPILFKDLYVPTFFSSYIYDSSVLKMYKEFAEKLQKPQNNESNTKIIYISRDSFSFPKRRIHNSTDIDNIFKEFNVKSLALEGLEFHQQVDLFRSADVVIAVHGAGLANMVFCRPGTDIILLEYKDVSEYEHLANACHLNVKKILCEQYVDVEYERANPSFQSRFRDIIAPIDVVRPYLGWLVKRRQIDSEVLSINSRSALLRKFET